MLININNQQVNPFNTNPYPGNINPYYYGTTSHNDVTYIGTSDFVNSDFINGNSGSKVTTTEGTSNIKINKS